MEEMPVYTQNGVESTGFIWMRSPLPTIISNRGDFADGTAVIADRQTAGKGAPGQKLVRSACRASDVSFGAFSFYENQ